MNYKKPVLILGIFTILIFSSLYFFNSKKSPITNEPILSPSKSVTPINFFSVNQKIIFGENKPQENTDIEVKQGESVLDVISRTKKIEIKEYSFGKLVESIEGTKNGTNNKYWIFYINGEESKVGAGDYKLKQNDKIEWKFKAHEK